MSDTAKLSPSRAETRCQKDVAGIFSQCPFVASAGSEFCDEHQIKHEFEEPDPPPPHHYADEKCARCHEMRCDHEA